MIKYFLAILITGMFRRIPGFAARHQVYKDYLANTYGHKIEFSKIKYHFFSGVHFEALVYENKKKALQIQCDHLTVSINLLQLFSRKKIVKSVQMQNATIRQLQGSETPASSTDNSGEILKSFGHLYGKAIKILATSFSIRPKNLDIRNVSYNYTMNELFGIGFQIQELKLRKGCFQFQGTVSQNGHQTSINTHGSIRYISESNSVEVKGDAEITRNDSAGNTGVLIKAENCELKGQFETCQDNGTNFMLTISLPFGMLNKNQIPSARADNKNIHVGISGKLNSNAFYIEKGAIDWGKLHVDFSVKHILGPEGRLSVNAQLKTLPFEDMLQSLPPVSFGAVYSASYTGNFGFTSNLSVSLQPPYNFDFNLKVDRQVKITEQRQLDFTYLKGPFVHTVYENGIPVQQIDLADTNPTYIPIKMCASFFLDALVIAEDRYFYIHKGVDFTAIGLAIITNLDAMRVVRGASTITMQLVRNLFLKRNRSFGKKIEELLLTWLVEEVFIVSKQRIMEIYINIIEFGPGVYGIGKAATAYFGKNPHELSLIESIVLTYVVPRPRHFIDALKSGSLILVKNLAKHIETITDEMVRRKMVSKDQLSDLPNEITFANNLGTIYFKVSV